ncbi:MAG: phage portal protein [Bacteroidaceae bacterium]|nr:phage portal protein [Bacteroidaceae bacterium]
MGLFSRKRVETQERDITPENNEPLSDLLLSCFLNGEKLTREKVLTIPAVSSNIDLISSSIATMPVKLYKKNGEQIEEIPNDKRTSLLNGDTGDTLSAYELKYALIRDYYLGGGGFCYIHRNLNKVIGLHYVNNERVTINYNFNDIFKDYTIFVLGNSYKPYEFIKILRDTDNGCSGKSITEELSTALETAYQTQIYQLSQVRTGGARKGFLKSERRLGQDEINALKNAWRRLYSTSSENVVVLNSGIDFKEASTSSVELQLNESIKTLAEQINNVFHIGKNFEETYKNSIYPLKVAFENALNRDLLLESEKEEYFFRLDEKELIKANIKERYEMYEIATRCGLNTINELREFEGLNRIEGLDVVNLNLASVLYDINTQKFFVPNTNSNFTMNDSEIGGKEEDTE